MIKCSTGLAVTAAALAAIVVMGGQASTAAASGTQQPAPAPCIFKLNEDPIACARLIRAHGHPEGRSWISPATGNKTLLYASEPYAAAVSISTVSTHALTPSGMLTFNGELPFTLAVDSSKHLYVGLLNPSGGSSVEVFSRNSKKPVRTYTNGITGALDVTVDSRGTLYVANFVSSTSCNVLEYAKGSMTPTATITDVPGCPNGVAVDANSNLYVTFIYYPPSAPWQTDVMKYAPGSTTGTRLNLKAPGLNDFYGIAVDANGNLVIADSVQAGMLGKILVFPAGSQTASHTMEYGDGWYSLFFALNGSRLFAPAYLEQGTTELTSIGDEPAEFEYPSGRERFVENPNLASPGFELGFAVSP